MIETVVYTHKGWFGICPVYLGGLAGETPSVMPRSAWADPLMELMTAVCDCLDWLMLRLGRREGLTVSFLLLQELDEPMTVHHEVVEEAADEAA